MDSQTAAAFVVVATSMVVASTSIAMIIGFRVGYAEGHFDGWHQLPRPEGRTARWFRPWLR